MPESSDKLIDHVKEDPEVAELVARLEKEADWEIASGTVPGALYDLSPEALTIRAAGPADLDTLLTLVDALADYEHLARPDGAARERFRKHFEAGTYFEGLLAEAGGQPVGYALYFFTYSSFLARPTLYLEDIFVLPEHRRHGAGTALMERLLEIAREQECGRIEWQVLDWNETAIGFYHRLGAIHMKEWLPYRISL